MGNPNHDRLGRFTTGRGGSAPLVSQIAVAVAQKRAQLSNDPALKVGLRPDGTMDYDVRGKYVNKKIDDLRAAGSSTESLYKVDGEWTPARRKQQQQLIEEIWVNEALSVPNDGEALFTGGLGGSGKGYAIGPDGFNISPKKYFAINPDNVKELMAKRGMLDETIKKFAPDLTPMEASSLGHEEASAITKRLAARAYRQRKNVLWDITMSSEKSVKTDRVDVMRSKGYTDIRGLFVDVTVDKSVAQAKKRWVGGMDDYIRGEGSGGRFLPSSATKENLPKEGSPYRSHNREVFESVKSSFNGYDVVDNMLTGDFPDRIVTSVGGGVKR